MISVPGNEWNIEHKYVDGRRNTLLRLLVHSCCMVWYMVVSLRFLVLFFGTFCSSWTCHISLFDKKKNFSYILYDRDARRWFLKGLLLLNENTVAVFVFIMFIRSTSVFSPFIFIIQRIVSKEKSCLVQSLLLFFSSIQKLAIKTVTCNHVCLVMRENTSRLEFIYTSCGNKMMMMFLMSNCSVFLTIKHRKAFCIYFHFSSLIFLREWWCGWQFCRQWRWQVTVFCW